ncbi:MAG: LysR family transcriptional regulator [Rhodospirillales bacterium]|nr:LysR family transcriptional regulator [Rhodospirillales bacterium]MCW8861816.1 LysR family transcriptional regulator [Rhodospirillales bacterium]MCW8952337.1 LysR family transcriptional regulator [Rhodospirillales bacterium]MCW9002765.1 LysR family transcriptional regulator [Rhodospirillales bacterium]
MKSSLAEGVSKTAKINVDEPRTIGFLGEDLRVYATPELVRDIEMTCRDLLLEHSDDGEDSVGTLVNVAHMAATPIGNWVEITATISKTEGPLVTFDISARDALDQVAKGTHQRFAVPVSKLEGKLRDKAAKLAGK